MPYQGGNRLPGEQASKLGHLDVIKSELVNEIINQFENIKPSEAESESTWEEINPDAEPLDLIFAVDGSLQTVRSDFPPYKELSFIKTALLWLDQHALAKLDPDTPHPIEMRDIMTESAMYHATVLPLKGVRIPGQSNYNTVRKIIFDSFQDASLGAEPYKTLKWLAYEKWTDKKPKSPNFDCPLCEQKEQSFAYDHDESECTNCKEHLYLTDMIGFHMEMSEEVARESLSRSYMLIHEMLLLFTGIRIFWEKEKFDVLGKSVFIKDGPLSLNSQYSKLAIPIRRFFEYAKNNNKKIYVVGQEKTGTFVEHLDIISRHAPGNSVFLPSNEYIRKEVQHAPERSEPYGSRTNYGNKLFVKLDEYHHLVISVPTGEYLKEGSKVLDDLIGVERILATLPKIISHRHECALVPVELANGVASLSNYPSAAILKRFANM